jgi:predicted nucleotidyltransferase
VPRKTDIVTIQGGEEEMRKCREGLTIEARDPTKEEILGVLETFFNHVQGVVLVFLFGSTATHRAHRMSDVDIGVLFKTRPRIDRIIRLRDKLISLLRKEVDLSVLNEASPILKMQVLKNGTLVYAADKAQFSQFFVDTVNQYDDLKRIRKPCEESILRGRLYA